MEVHAEPRSRACFRFQSCTSLFRLLPFSFFLLLLINVALNPVSSHALQFPIERRSYPHYQLITHASGVGCFLCPTLPQSILPPVSVVLHYKWHRPFRRNVNDVNDNGIEVL